MSLGRRRASLDDPSRWVFNKMADAYPARPAYPAALVDRLAELARGGTVLDVGAGIGHVALPLASRGLRVIALEPAVHMLERLSSQATASGTQSIEPVHATAEAMPVADGSIDLAVIADATHFLDAERCGHELDRVLARDGVLAVVAVGLDDTAFMRGVIQAMESGAPRRPRTIEPLVAQLFALARIKRIDAERFADATLVDPDRLERILRSISYIGPAMNETRFAELSRAVRALPHPPVWARTFDLRLGRR